MAPTGEISQEAEKLVTKIYRINYADIKEVEKSLGKFVSQRGAISTNPGTSNIIVKDTESNIKAIDTFIEEIDRITPQILVEARIYDITSKNKLDLGVEWMAGRNTTYYDGTGTATIPPGTLGANPRPAISTPSQRAYSPALPARPPALRACLKFGWLKDNLDIDVVIKGAAEPD